MKRELPENQPTLLKPWEIIEPAVGANNWPLLMSSQSARAASAADLATPPPRAGSEDALHCPSRVGDRLHYRSGLVTDMAGRPINPKGAHA